MIAINKPEDWKCVFKGSQTIYLDDSGIIYDSDNEHKVKIGKIDLGSGLIYEEKQGFIIGQYLWDSEEGVYKIYGWDYDEGFSVPIAYVKNGKYYTKDEYYKFLYMSGDQLGKGRDDIPKGEGDNIGKVAIKIIAFILAMLAVILITKEAFLLFFGQLDIPHASTTSTLAWIAIAVGAIIAFVFETEYWQINISMTVTFNILGFLADCSWGELSPGVIIFTDVVLGIINVITFLIPAAIVYFLVSYVKGHL